MADKVKGGLRWRYVAWFVAGVALNLYSDAIGVRFWQVLIPYVIGVTVDVVVTAIEGQ